MDMQYQLNILGNNSIPVSQDVVITLTKGKSNSIDQERKEKCKILKFSSVWKFDEILSTISRLESKIYPNLFIFIIDQKSFGFFETKEEKLPEKMKILQENLLKFNKNRSMILQLTSKDENVTKFYYREENSEEFHDVKEQVADTGYFVDFLTFLWLYLSEKVDDFEDLMLKKLPKVANSSLILRFVRTLELSEDFFNKLVLKCAEEGSKSELLASIDEYIDEECRLQGLGAEHFLTSIFNSTSVLCAAVQNSNQEVINFLMKNCTDLIQQLPFEHQVEVSSVAFATNQFEILCELLEFCDFPFPRDLDPESVNDEKISKIINDRIKFHKDILEENFTEIEAFVKNNPILKFAYSIKNKSAFWSALNSSKFQAFFRLKTFGFEDRFVSFSKDDIDNDKERAKASRFARIQRRRNVEKSSKILDENNAVMLLATKTLIFRRPRNSRTEEEQRNKILNWYAEIYATKFSLKILDAVVQCDELKIIFDFEYQSVENVDVSASDETLGVTYPTSKWIFIGAKLTGEAKREQEIKGVIAHEICHYVMRLVYQNKERPHYGDDEEAAKKFDEITAEIESMLFPPKVDQLVFRDKEIEERQVKLIKEDENEAQIQSDEEGEANSEDEIEEINEPLDDECEGIVSLVYTHYDKEDWQPELIVRPAHIQAQFDDDEEKIKQLEQKYKNLFKFWEKFVVPELEKFNIKGRENVQNFNKIVGILPEVQRSKIKLSKLQDKKELVDSQITIVTTNAPKIFLINVYMQLHQNCESSLDFRNIFMTSQSLDNCYVSTRFKEILRQDGKFNIFVDCSRGHKNIFKLDAECKKSKLIFIVSNKNLCGELDRNLAERRLVTAKSAISYNWMDLTAESREYLLQTKINFQNNSTISLSELISTEIDQQRQESINTENLAEIIDDQLLNLLVEETKIYINPQSEEEIGDKCFRVLFQSRDLIKNIEINQNHESFNEQEEPSNEVQENFLFQTIVNLASTFLNISNQPVDTLAEDSTHIQKIVETNKPRQIFPDQMLEIVKNKKFVLISDKAGSGKSWILKNFTNKLRLKYPRKWTTYVDLKQFINEFKSQDGDLEFSSFMVEKIIKPKTNYEAEIFKKLYKNGQVCILFDGFDEIAPDCTEFVTKLFQSFQQNGQNQLWIATRDYFEVNLKEKLEIDDVYKLDEFTDEHGVELISTSWILSEVEGECANLSTSDFEVRIKNSPNLQDYKEIAGKLCRKIPKSETNSIALPQFYKMIADITKNNKNAAIDYTKLRLFEECVNIQYNRWAKEKGELRARANIASQHNDLNYHKLHQTVAMGSLFPADSQFCDLNRLDLKTWTDEEIIACGLLMKQNGKFFFSHETFREFYAAAFIMRILTQLQYDENICKYLIQFLTVEKYKVIRMFLNEAFGVKQNMKEIEPKIPKMAQKFSINIEKFEKSSEIFEEDLEHLAEFLIKIIKNWNRTQIINILSENKNIAVFTTKYAYLFTQIQKLIFDYFAAYELEDFLEESGTFFSIIVSIQDEEATLEFLHKVEEKISPEFIKETLKMEDEKGESIFFYLIRSKDADIPKFQGILHILEKFLTFNEIADLARNSNKHGMNFLHLCSDTNNVEKMKYLWTELAMVFKSANPPQNIAELVNQKVSESDGNFLHIAAKCDEIQLHENLWQFLVNSFENREQLKELMLQRNKFGNNFIHNLVINDKPDIIHFTFRKIRENFSASQYETILKSRGEWERNLLQIAAVGSKDIKTHQILWKTYQDFSKTDEEFLEFLKEVDSDNNHVFHLAAIFSTSEILEFMIEELEIVSSLEKIRKTLNTLGLASRHLQQSAAINNKSLELHQSLWKIIQKYFGSSEIVDMIKHADEYGDNILHNAVENNTKEIVELTWNEIEALNEEKVFGLMEYLSHTNKWGEYVLHNLVKSRDVLKLKYFWKELENFFDTQNSLKQFKKLLSQKTSENQTVLHIAANCDQIEFHETLWELLMDSCKNREELKDFILQGDKDGNNLIHYLIYHNKPDIIEFTLKKIKEDFSAAQYDEILRSEGQRGRNLLQTASNKSKDIKTHNILWKICRDSCKSDEEFLEFLKEVDSHNNNVFHNAASFSTSEIFEFLMVELECIAPREEIKNILSTLGFAKKNLLQSAAKQNKCLQFHQSLWKIIQKYFESSEILDMVKHPNENGNNNLKIAVQCNSKEVVELTWHEIKNIFSKSDNKALLEYLKSTNNEGENILHVLAKGNDEEKLKFFWIELKNYFTVQKFSQQIKELFNQETSENRDGLHTATNCDQTEFDDNLWKVLLKTLENRDKLKDLITQKDHNGDNFIHLLVINDNVDIIEFIFEKIKKIFGADECQKIFKSKGQRGRNLLQAVANVSQNIETVEFLWKIFRDFCKSDEEFLKILKKVDGQKNNVFHIAVAFSTSIILKFMIKNLEKIASDEEIWKILNTLGFENQNLLQIAAIHNKSFEFHQSLWKIVPIFFHYFGIVNMIIRTDELGNNVLQYAVECNTKDIVELTWNEIKAINEEKVFGLMEYLSHTNKEGENVLHNLLKAKDALKLKYFWKELENFFAFQNSSQQFKKLLSQKTSENQTVLHIAANCEQMEFHETLWELLMESCKNREELKELIIHEDKDGNNFVHRLLIFNKPDTIEFTLEKIKANFSAAQYEEILRSKGQWGRNLLQTAACASKDIKTHQILWKLFQDSCKSVEDFFKILREVDSQNNNVFHNAALFSASDIFGFMIKELEKIASIEEIKKMLNTSGLGSHNLLQLAVKNIKSLEFHQNLWKIIQKYFESLEIVDIIKHSDKFGNNLLLNALQYNTREVTEVTWNEIRNILIPDCFFEENLSESCDECYEHLINALESSQDKIRNRFQERFIKLVEKFQSFDSRTIFEKKLNQEILLKDPKVLHRLAPCDKIKFHEASWEILLNNFENKEDLKNLMLIEDATKNNFVHLLVINDKPEIIEFTFGIFRQNFTDDQYKEILTSKGENERNLIQQAACESKDIKTHQILWKTFRDFCKSDEEFLKILEEVDEIKSNVFHLAASFTTSETLEFMIEELEKIVPKEEIKKLLSILGFCNENILQAANSNNKSLKLHEKLWEIIQKYFCHSEIFRLINYCDNESDNILHDAVYWTTKDIVVFTWKQIQKFIDEKDDRIEYLSRIGHYGHNLMKLSSENQVKDPEVQVWVENLMNEYEIETN